MVNIEILVKVKTLMVIELEEEKKTLAAPGPRVPHPSCPIKAGHGQWLNQNGMCPSV